MTFFLPKSSRNNELIIYGKRLDKKGKVMVINCSENPSHCVSLRLSSEHPIVSGYLVTFSSNSLQKFAPKLTLTCRLRTSPQAVILTSANSRTD